MKQVEYWRWRRRNKLTGKLTRSVHMDEASATAGHPEAVRVPGTMELRWIAESEDERQQHMYRCMFPGQPLDPPKR